MNKKHKKHVRISATNKSALKYKIRAAKLRKNYVSINRIKKSEGKIPEINPETGNGPIKNEIDQIKIDRKKYLRKYLEDHKTDKRARKGKNKPWYMLRSWELGKIEASRTPIKLTREKRMERHENAMLQDWERKNPKPIIEDETQKDLFENQFIPQWEEERKCASKRIRDFVVSIYDKLPLTGRFQKTENNFSEEHIADLKDKQHEGHKINELDPKKSKLLKKAQKVTDDTKAKKKNLVCTNLKDHKGERGRIILPKAA